MVGLVSFVGAGPGDPGLITVRGYRALEDADVIIYDELVNVELLCPFRNKELHGLDQMLSRDPDRLKYIFQIFSRKTQEGKHVARLKGGDPLIFGRAYEEIRFLKDSKIDYQIIPGITAALGAAAYAEIPLTQRGVSSSVAFCTGHSATVKVPQADTLVYYMGSERLPKIFEEVLKKGYPKESCITVIQNATKTNQLIITTSLNSALEHPPVVESPVILIIRSNIKDNGNRVTRIPRKKKILVTGTSAFRYQKLGEVTHLPLIKVKELEDYYLLDDCLRKIKQFDLIIFTSQYGVRAFIKRLFSFGFDARSISESKIAAIGKQTANELKKSGIIADLVPINENSDGLLEVFTDKIEVRGLNILLLQSQLSDDYLVTKLNKSGAKVTNTVAYSIEKCKKSIGIDISSFYAIIFTSPSTVTAFKDIYGIPSPDIKIWCRGVRTQEESKKIFDRGEVIKNHETYNVH